MNQSLFEFNTSLSPREKFRGKKRYYRRLLQKAENFSLELEGDDWFEFWHKHVDMAGISNNGKKHREFHIEALAKMFMQITKQAGSLNVPYQAWLAVHRMRGHLDGVFLHTPNPSKDIPPFKLKDIEWGYSQIEEYLEGYFPNIPIRAGKLYWEPVEDTVYIVYSPALGETIE